MFLPKIPTAAPPARSPVHVCVWELKFFLSHGIWNNLHKQCKNAWKKVGTRGIISTRRRSADCVTFTLISCTRLLSHRLQWTFWLKCYHWCFRSTWTATSSLGTAQEVHRFFFWCFFNTVANGAVYWLEFFPSVKLQLCESEKVTKGQIHREARKKGIQYISTCSSDCLTFPAAVATCSSRKDSSISDVALEMPRAHSSRSLSSASRL